MLNYKYLNFAFKHLYLFIIFLYDIINLQFKCLEIINTNFTISYTK